MHEKKKYVIHMTVQDLINELQKYPMEARVATPGMPFEDIEVSIRHFEDDPRIEEFDYVSID